MSTNRHKNRILFVMMLLVFAFCISCSHKDNKNDNTPTNGVNNITGKADTGNVDDPDSISPTDKVDLGETQLGEDDSKTPSGSADSADSSSGDDVAQSAGDDEQEEDPEGSDPAGETKEYPVFEGDKASRAEIWDLTWLKWLPLYTDGVFDSNSAADTFDYACFTDVSRDAVISYIDELIALGFAPRNEYSTDGDVIDFHGTNSDDWSACVELTDGRLTISSGYFEEEEDDLSSVFSDTMLANLPAFEAGVMDSIGQESDGSDYVIFTDVSENDVRDYLSSVRSLGFTLDVDEGDSDGIIWFYGVNSEDIYCDITYYDFVIKIICGKG